MYSPGVFDPVTFTLPLILSVYFAYTTGSWTGGVHGQTCAERPRCVSLVYPFLVSYTLIPSKRATTLTNVCMCGFFTVVFCYKACNSTEDKLLLMKEGVKWRILAKLEIYVAITERNFLIITI